MASEKDFPKRLRQAIQPYSQTEFADRHHLNEGQLSKYLSGKAFPRGKAMGELAKAANVTVPWLHYGIEPMRPGPGEQPPPFFAVESVPVSLPETMLKAYGVASTDSLSFVVAADDEMAPEVRKGEVLLISSAKRNVTKGMEVLATREGFIVRNVRFDDQGMVHLASKVRTTTVSFIDMPTSGISFYGSVVAVLRGAADLQQPAPSSSAK